MGCHCDISDISDISAPKLNMHYLEIARRVIARQQEAQSEDASACAAPPQLPPDIDDYLALFYERAAICEYDGGLDREAAERLALRQVLAVYAEVGLRDMPENNR